MESRVSAAGFAATIYVFFCAVLSGADPLRPLAAERIAAAPWAGGTPFLRVFAGEDYGGTSINLHVTCLPSGLVYVGNSLHVIEYDGVAWRPIPQPSLSHSSALVPDAEARIWTSTRGKLGQLVPDATGALRFESRQSRLPAKETATGELLGGLATPAGVYLYSATRIYFLPRNGAASVWRAGTRFESLFWMDGAPHATETGRGLLRLSAGKFIPVATGVRVLQRVFAARALATDSARQLILTRRGPFLWAGPGAELEPLTPESAAQFASPSVAASDHSALHAIFLSDGRLAFGTANNGLLIFSPEGRLELHLTKADGLPSDRVNELAEDTEGGLWLAQQKGLTRVQLDSPYRFQAGLRGLDENVRDVVRHQGRLYVALGEGVAVQAAGTGAFRALEGLPPDTPGATSFLPLGDRLLVNASGVCEITPEGRLVSLSPRELFALHATRREPGSFLGLQRDANGRALWLLRSAGETLRVEGKVGAVIDPERFGFDRGDGTFWGTDVKDRVWRADFRGGVRVDAPVAWFELGAQPPSGSEKMFITVAFPFGDGVEAACAGKLFRFDDALCRFVSETRITALPDGLGYNAPDPGAEGAYWFRYDGWGNSPRVRLFHVAPDRPGHWQAREFPTGEIGYLPVHKLYAEPGTSILWICSAAGLFSADTSWHPHRTIAPPHVFVRRIETAANRLIFAGDTGLARPPALAATETSLRVDFAAPVHTVDFRGRTQTSYRTKLEGLERDWTPWSHEPYRTFTNLPPGTFTFHVQARDLDDREGKSAEFAFIRLPPWWRTWWMIGLASMAGIGGVALVTRWSAHRVLQRRVARLEAQSAIERERFRLARDLHDEVGSGLGRVILFAGEAERVKSDPAKLDATLHRVRDSAQELVQHAREIVWAVSPQHDALAAVIERLGDYTEETLRTAGIACIVKAPPPEKIPPLTLGSDARHSLFLALKEAVHNCVKYSEAKTADLTLAIAGDDFVVTLRDHGRGFAPGEQRGSGHGTRNLAARAEALGGQAAITSEPGRGTTIVLRVPLRPAAKNS